MIANTSLRRRPAVRKRHTSEFAWTLVLVLSPLVAPLGVAQSVTSVTLSAGNLRFAAADSRGNAVTVQYGEVVSYDAAGRLANVVPLPPIDWFVSSFALDGADVAYLAGFDGSNIATVFAPARPGWKAALTGTAFRPVAIGFDPQNNVVVFGSDSNIGFGMFNSRVVKLDRGTGEILADYRFPVSVPVTMAVDRSGAVYVTGVTGAPPFPTTAGAYEATPPSDGWQTYAAKLDGSLKVLTASTLVGGGYPSAIAAAADGSFYVAGTTPVPNVPTTAGAFQPVAPQHGLPPTNPPRSMFFPLTYGWIVHVSADARSLQAGTYLAGNGSDAIGTVAVDEAGDVVVSGFTQSTDFPATGASAIPCGPAAVRQSSSTTFVTKLDAGLGQVLSSALVPQTGLQVSNLLPQDVVYGAAYSGGRLLRIALNARSSVACMVNGASYRAESVVAAGQLVTIFGTGLGNVQVFYTGVAVPVLAQSDTQINVVIPSNFSPGEGSLDLFFRGALVQTWPVHGVLENATSLLRFGDDGQLVFDLYQPTALADVLNADGSRNSKSNPAHGGETVTIFATGIQGNNVVLQSGSAQYTASVESIADRPGVEAVRFVVPRIDSESVGPLPFRLGTSGNDPRPDVFLYVAR